MVLSGSGSSISPQFQLRHISLLISLLSLATSGDAAAFRDGPVGGSPFLLNSPLKVLPSPEADGKSVQMSIYRLGASRTGANPDDFSAHSCDMGDAADMKQCLGKPRGCMWTTLTTRDPLKRVQATSSYCLPCEMDGQEMPCWNVGAWVDGKQVLDCRMSCGHQQKIVQPEYECSDDSGYISLSQCLSKGASTGSKCMYIEYDDKGLNRASCAPCQLEGAGGWGCPPVGVEGPIAGTKVKSCVSQCDVICAGPPACPPTLAPPPPLPPQQSPGLPAVSGPADEMVNAPAPWVGAPTVNPYGIIEAARAAAEKAGLKVMMPSPPPKIYWPVVYYRSPQDLQYTTGPPPVAGPEVPVDSLLQTGTKKNLLRAQRQPRPRHLRHQQL